jgi:hypothetical protein
MAEGLTWYVGVECMRESNVRMHLELVLNPALVLTISSGAYPHGCIILEAGMTNWIF